MLTYADVCCMLTYADVCGRMLLYLLLLSEDDFGSNWGALVSGKPQALRNSASASIRQLTSAYACVGIRQHTCGKPQALRNSASASIRQHTSAYA